MKKIVIIGAGLAGLSAGIFARKKGYDVTIYESHFLSGGMCAGWKRKGYVFEGCQHYIKLIGKSKSGMFYKLWKELGVWDNAKIITQDYIQALKDSFGRVLHVYTDPKRLHDEMITLSKDDKKMIDELYKTVKRCYWFTHSSGFNPFRLIWRIFNILLAMPFLFKYGSMSLKEYANGFKDPLIQKALSELFEHDAISCVQLPMFLGMYHKEGVGFPEGGSLAFINAIEQTLIKSGGKIEYRKKVKKIVVKNNQAKGIQLEDDSIVNADIVISAADAYNTLFNLLENRYTSDKYLELFEKQPLYNSFVQVSLGVNRPMNDLPYAIKIQTKDPFEIAGKTNDYIWLIHFDYDKTLAPNGKNTIIILYHTDFEWWEKIGYKTTEYEAEKKRILDETVRQLEKILPAISTQIEVSDVSTPFTTIRYTHNHKAAIGFMPNPSYIQELRKPQYKIDGLDNFYMAGQWVSGMGLPNVALSGQNVIKMICQNEKKNSRK